MTVLYELIVVVLSFVEVTLCYCFCAELLDRQLFKNHKLILAVCSVLLSLATAYHKMLIFFSYIFLTFVIVVICLYLIIILKARVVSSFCVVANYYLLLSLIDYILLFFVTAFVRDKYFAVYTEIGFGRIIIYSAARLIMVVILLTIKTYNKKQNIEVPEYHKILIVSGIIGYAWIFWSQYSLLKFGESKALKNGISLSACIMLLVFLYSVFIKGINIRKQSQMISIKNEMLEKNYQNLYQLYQNNRFISHDLKNHMLIIKTYLDKQEYEKVREYLDKLTGSVAGIDHITWSKCEMINLVLNLKCHEAAQNSIRIITDIDDIDWRPYNENDLGIILFNLLDNALEACQQLDTGEKWISIAMKKKNKMSIIKIENSIKKGSMNSRQPYTTTKKEKDTHGYGMKSIQAAVERYGGRVSWDHKEDRFTAVITFFENEMIKNN